MSEDAGLSVADWVTTIVCLLLQVLLAPHIAIGGTMPLFLLVPLFCVAVSSSMTVAVVFGFLLGFLYDLGTGEAMGVMSLAFTVAAAGVQLLGVDGDGAGVNPLVTIAAVVVVQLLQGILLGIAGYADSAGYIIVHCILLGSLYNGIITLAGMALIRAISNRKAPVNGPSRRLR